MSNVVQFPTLHPEAMRGCEYVPAHRCTLVTLDGTPFADALCHRHERWDWIVAVVAEELRVYPEQIGCEDDWVTVDGMPVLEIR